MLVSLWDFDTILVSTFPIFRLDFGYHIDALSEHIRNPTKNDGCPYMPSALAYSTTWMGYDYFISLKCIHDCGWVLSAQSTNSSQPAVIYLRFEGSPSKASSGFRALFGWSMIQYIIQKKKPISIGICMWVKFFRNKVSCIFTDWSILKLNLVNMSIKQRVRMTGSYDVPVLIPLLSSDLFPRKSIIFR